MSIFNDVESGLLSGGVYSKEISIENSEIKFLIEQLKSENYSDFFEPFEINDSLQKWSSNWKPSSDLIQNLKLLIKSIGILKFYVHANYTGGPSSLSSLPEKLINWFENLDAENASIDQLLMGGEELHSNIQYSSTLLLFSELANLVDESICPSINWWKIRGYFLHEEALEEKSSILWGNICSLIDNCEETLLNNIPDALQSLFHAELVTKYIFHYDYKQAKYHMLKSNELAGMNVYTKGAMGKRTKYQIKSLPQLMLKVELSKQANLEGQEFFEQEFISSNSPRISNFIDDIRLDEPLLDEQEEMVSDLNYLQSFLLLNNFLLVRKVQPNDGPVYENECLTYLNVLLKYPKYWCNKMVSLYHRALLESSRPKNLDRSMAQLEALEAAIKSDSPSSIIRFQGFFGSGLPRNTEISLAFGSILESMSMTKSALDIYMKLKDWDSCIRCLMVMSEPERARKLIHQQIKENGESVKLWILMGDANSYLPTESAANEEDDEIPSNTENCYLKAWEMSNRKSARALRHLGYYFFRHKQYENCVKYLEQSLELNPLESLAWLRLGFSALSVQNWEVAAKAYRNYCNLDDDNFQAWNNLAKAYIQLEDKPRAFKVLKESIKCNFEVWEVWDNLLSIAMELKYFSEAIRAYQRIIEIRGIFIDEKVIGKLAEAVYENIKDSNDDGSFKYRKSILTLCAQVSHMSPPKGSIFWAYSDVLYAPEHLLLSENVQVSNLEVHPIEKEVFQRCLQMNQKAISIFFGDSSWDKLTEKISKTLDCLLSLLKKLIKYKDKYSNFDEIKDIRSTTIMNSNKALTTFKMKRAKGMDTSFVDDKLKEITEFLNLIQLE